MRYDIGRVKPHSLSLSPAISEDVQKQSNKLLSTISNADTSIMVNG